MERKVGWAASNRDETQYKRVRSFTWMKNLRQLLPHFGGEQEQMGFYFKDFFCAF